MSPEQKGQVNNKLLETFIESFKAMPAWLKNLTIVTLIGAFLYFGFVQKQIVYHKEKAQMEYLQGQVKVISVKVQKMESVNSGTTELMRSLTEIRKVFLAHEASFRNHTHSLARFLEKITPPEHQAALDRFEKEEYEQENIYRNKINEIFENQIIQLFDTTAVTRGP